MSLPKNEPPLYTLLMELTGWTQDHTADIPKNARFTFGQRMDNLTLDALQEAVVALRSPAGKLRHEALQRLDLCLEKLRGLWRLVHQRTWISQGQLLHVQNRLEEAVRMVGGWKRKGAVRRDATACCAAALLPAGGVCGPERAVFRRGTGFPTRGNLPGCGDAGMGGGGDSRGGRTGRSVPRP